MFNWAIFSCMTKLLKKEHGASVSHVACVGEANHNGLGILGDGGTSFQPHE